MDRPGLRPATVITAHALVLWMLCGALMVVGMNLLSLDVALVMNAMDVPMIVATISWIYFKQFHETTPLVIACRFVGHGDPSGLFRRGFIDSAQPGDVCQLHRDLAVFALLFTATYGGGHSLSHHAEIGTVVRR